MKKLIMMKSILIMFCMILFLVGCSQQKNTLYYAEHPEKLKIILIRCDKLGQAAISNKECGNAAGIYYKLVALSHQLVKDPEVFGKSILSRQITLVKLQEQLKHQKDSEDKVNIKKLETEIKNLKNDIKLRIYFASRIGGETSGLSVIIGYYFPLMLIFLVFLSGIIWLVDKLFFAKQRKVSDRKEPSYVDYSRSFFPVFLIVLIIRSFLGQPMVVPSGSLEPTILTQEYLVINMYKYGFRLPILQTKIIPIDEPKRGDIVVFTFPGNSKVNFIKRVIGVSGDHVIYKNKTLYVNNKEMTRTFVKNVVDQGEEDMPVQVWNENFDGIKHQIYLHNSGGSTTDYDFTVPKGMYFMMGDNRDGSADSRFWGFLPEKDIIGKAEFIWMSWDSKKHWFRWSRIGNKLYNS